MKKVILSIAVLTLALTIFAGCTSMKVKKDNSAPEYVAGSPEATAWNELNYFRDSLKISMSRAEVFDLAGNRPPSHVDVVSRTHEEMYYFWPEINRGVRVDFINGRLADWLSVDNHPALGKTE